MKVKNLVHWAGPNWEHEAGTKIELDDATALARCDAGLCSALDAEELEAARRRVSTAAKARKAAA